MIPTVAKLPLVSKRRDALKTGVGRIGQQHFKLCPEQIRPAASQVLEQDPLVGQQPIQTAIQRILDRHRKVRSQQLSHRTVLIPMPMHSPLAARFDSPTRHQPLQGCAPHGRARCRLNCSSWTWTPSGHAHRQWPIDGQQCQLHLRVRFGVEDIVATDPRFALAVVDLAQIQHLALHHSPVGTTTALDDRPVAVFFAVLDAVIALQQHDGHRL
jgi:hypothetical protein